MEIITGLNFNVKNSSISLGKFDGIHLGHRLLLQNILEKEEMIPTVFTFEIGKASQKIYTQDEKNEILKQMGIQREIIFPFTTQTKNMGALEFIEEILVKRMDVRHICVGTDFRFGRNREGDVNLLAKYQDVFGYTLDVIPKLTDGEEIISSSLIRIELERGNLARINELLGQHYFIQGEVLHGNALGRTMGMPTANLLPGGEKLLLPYGVYATKVLVKDNWYCGVTNIGKKPTIGEYAVGVETYIMDFHKVIYGEKILVQFEEFIRPERKFDNMEKLFQQIGKDKAKAAEILTC